MRDERRFPRTRLIGLAFLALSACRADPAGELGLGLPRGATLVLRADWRTLSPEDFETWVEGALPDGFVTPLEADDRRTLQHALDEVTTKRADGTLDPLAVRAAVILGRSHHPSCAAILIRRLEKRVLGPERYSDCGDSVAAVALARFPNLQRYTPRLVPLAVGAHPHPDLEVRVECAAAALRAGVREVIPFLLQVLRIDTYAGQKDVRDFAVSPTTAWARGRAAEAL